jgi:hypothetical protein
MNKEIDDFISMNQDGLVLELCEKYYDPKVLMLSNGEVFAESMREAYDKQKGFVGSIKEFDIKLLSRTVEKNFCELVFHYKMTTQENKLFEYSGRHSQTWKSGKIIKEEFSIVEVEDGKVPVIRKYSE